MTDFTKTKIAFVLALLGTLFTLHPLVDRFAECGYDYMGVPLKVFHVYVLFAALLSLSVYFYALVMHNERTHSWAERTGNMSYALALMVLPLYGGLYSAKLLAERVGQSHLAWAAPAVTAVLGVLWVGVSQLVAWSVKNHLAHRDQSAVVDQLALQEIGSLTRAQEMFTHGHFDLSVIEAWRAIESRLRRVLLLRGVAAGGQAPNAVFDTAIRLGVIGDSARPLLDELQRHWQVAVSTVPLGKDAAEAALSAARGILATISVEGKNALQHGSPVTP
jgi:hypothetical protein